MPENPPRHTPLQDAQGILTGSMLCAFSVLMLKDQGLVTGQTAGTAVLISYLSGYGFGLIFFLLNLPFYWFGYMRVGGVFVLKSLAAVALMSAFSAILPHYVMFDYLHPLAASVLAGLTAGTGLIAIFRHGASLGGIGIVGLYVQDSTGFRAGWFQMAVDALIFLVAFWLLDPRLVAYSLIGALIVNLTIAVNHRRDYYIAY